MAKQFYFYFGNGLPGSYTGLSPSFIIFNINGISATPGPGITEFASAGATGMYGFQYGISASVAFVIDGGATLTSTNIRYLSGSLDPVLSIDQSIGFSTDSFGSTNIDPPTMYGQLKRQQEFNEGNKTYNKTTGVWDISSRGSSTLLREKTLVNSSGTASSS